MQTVDSKGITYALGRVIGQGGEATIYQIAGHPTLLAKIYLDPRSGYEGKLLWMRNTPPDDPSKDIGHASIAWPMDVLYTPRGKFAGYLMPHITGAVLLLQVFNPHMRSRTLPTFNEVYLHRTARNLAAALGAIHERGYVVGDLNESNVLVTASTLVTLIDTDSFQVRAKNRFGQTITYHCPVGKPDYTPPELQGKSLDRVRRKPEHDRFALATLIFQLLMEGIHPFKAQWQASGDPPPLEVRIKRGWYPYRKGRGLPITAPRGALPLDSLYPKVADLMDYCFIDGHRDPGARPTPEEWEDALGEAEGALKPCGKGHYFSKHLSACPRCERLHQIARGKARRTTVHVPLRFPTPPAPKSPASRPRGGTAPPWRRIPHIQLPAFPVTAHPLQRTGWKVARFMSGSFGTLVGAGFLGAVGGGLLGNWLGEGLGGQIAGGLGGIVTGALFSEIIYKTVGWDIFLGGTGSLVGWWLVWNGGGEGLAYGVGGLVGGLIGWLLGKFGRQTGWVLLWAMVGGFAGYSVGRVLGTVTEIGWAGGALSGLVVWLVTGGMYELWVRYGK